LQRTVKKEGQVQDINSARRSARVANIQAGSVTSREKRPPTARKNASDASLPGRTPIDDTVPQSKSTPQVAEPLVDSVNTASLTTSVGVKWVESDLVVDASAIKPTRMNVIVEEPLMPNNKVGAEDCISAKLTDFMQPSQENEVVMIDLTQDSPKALQVVSSPENRALAVTITTRSSPPEPERPRKLPRPILPSPKDDTPRVTFTSLSHNHQIHVASRSSSSDLSDSRPLSKKNEAGT